MQQDHLRLYSTSKVKSENQDSAYRLTNYCTVEDMTTIMDLFNTKQTETSLKIQEEVTVNKTSS